MRLPLLLIVLAAGCGSVEVIDPGGARAVSPNQGLSRVPPLELEACITGNGDIMGSIAEKAFTSVFIRVRPQAQPTCDVLIDVPRLDWLWSLSAARSGDALFTVIGHPGAGSNLAAWMPRAVYERLAPGTPLAAKLGEERRLAPKREAAPAFSEGPPPSATARRSSDVDSPRYRAAERPQDFAVIVGIEKYSDLPDASYAEADAAAVRAHIEALGVPPRNIAFLAGTKAGRASLEKYLEDWLPRLAKPEGRVFFYFSGHGAPDPATGEPYLVPWDGDPNFLARTAYPVKRLYAKLSELRSRKILVMLDSCFSGAGGRSVLPAGTRPLVAKMEAPSSGRLTVLTAAADNQITGSVPDKGHGAFTYFLLKGLNGEAKDFTAGGLHSYLTPRVQDEAARVNRTQDPRLLGDTGLLLR